MVEEGYDLVIRVNPSPDENLVGRAFLRDRLVVVASPTVRPPTDDTAAPAVLRSSAAQTLSWQVTSSGEPRRIVVRPVLHLSSMIMVRDAVRDGAGAATLPVSLVSKDIAEGRLVSWGEVIGPDIALWALYPSRRLLSARVSAFLDYLKAAFPTGEPEELAAFLEPEALR